MDRLPSAKEAPSVRLSVELMFDGYDQAVKQGSKLRQQLTKEAKSHEAVVRFTAPILNQRHPWPPVRRCGVGPRHGQAAGPDTNDAGPGKAEEGAAGRASDRGRQ